MHNAANAHLIIILCVIMYKYGTCCCAQHTANWQAALNEAMSVEWLPQDKQSSTEYIWSLAIQDGCIKTHASSK